MTDKEIGRWQQAIYEACCKAIEGLRDARDGPLCESEDPLVHCLAEIGRATGSLRDEIDLLRREHVEARAEVERLRESLSAFWAVNEEWIAEAKVIMEGGE